MCAVALTIPVVFGSGPEDQDRNREEASRGVTVGPQPAHPGTGVAPRADDQVAPLLGTWKWALSNGQDFGVRTIAIKLVPNGPDFAEALGFEAPFVCTLTYLAPDGQDAKPSMLVFVDPNKNPAHLTLLPVGTNPSDGNYPDGFPGIYRVEGDTLTIHYTILGDRPSDFDQKRGERTTLDVFVRADEPPGAAAKSDLDRLQGEWERETTESGPVKRKSRVRLVVKGDTFLFGDMGNPRR